MKQIKFDNYNSFKYTFDMLRFKNNKLIFILICFISILLICVYSYFNRYNCLYNDNFNYGTYYVGERIFDCLFKDAFLVHGGGYTTLFLTKFFNFGLPNLIGIHPENFITYPLGCIKGIFLSITFICFSLFSIFFHKSKTIYLSVFLFLCTYFFYTIEYYTNTTILAFNTNNFFRYIFTLMCYSILLYFIFKNLLFKSKKTHYFYLILASLCAVVVGSNIEIILYSMSLLVIFIFIYNIVSKLMRKKGFNLDKNFYIPIFVFFTIMSIYISSPGYKEISSEREVFSSIISFDILREFSDTYFQILITNQILYWILFAVLTGISFYFAIKKDEVNKVILPLFLQVSFLIVMFSLIFCGKTYHNQFWLNRQDIIFLFELLILYPLFLYISYILYAVKTQFKNKEYIRLLVYGVSCFLILLSLDYIFLVSISQKSIYKYINLTKNMKLQRYMDEKIIRFYLLKGETPKLKSNLTPTFITTTDIIINENGKKEYIQGRKDSAYFQKIYKTDKFKRYKIYDNAIQDYQNKGGTFSEKEIKDMNFQKLLDDNFILNN